MNVVLSLEDASLEQIVDQIAAAIVQRLNRRPRDKWVNGTETMRLLGVKVTTLQRLRDEGKIRFSQSMPKNIMYDTASIDAYLEKHAKNPF